MMEPRGAVSTTGTAIIMDLGKGPVQTGRPVTLASPAKLITSAGGASVCLPSADRGTF